ncbi:MAG: hypothetical protein IIB44_13750 [Candidatus Marinimicrobia bacterium]|nr:hypothetical protein [Candidatus Neomarinimicrobiota bacterium]
MSETMPNEIILTLPPDKVSEKVFKTAVSAFLDMVHKMGESVTKGSEGHIQWFYSVRGGSNCFVATGEPVNCPPHILDHLSQYPNGIDQLNKTPSIPAGFDYNLFGPLEKLASLTKEAGSIDISINNEHAAITELTYENVKKITDVKYEAWGSIEGKLQMITEHGRLMCRIYEILDDNPVEVGFKEEFRNTILDNFGKRVSIIGEVKYDSLGKAKKVVMEDIYIYPSNLELPSFKDVTGILKK